MTEAEFTIVNFLQSSLAGLLLKSVIEQNAGGLYRLKKGEELP